MNQKYENAKVAVDAVILTIKDQQLYVFLNTRDKQPFVNELELPGGLLLPDETADQTLTRKIEEVTQTKSTYFQQFKTFTDPIRDPRERTISIGFIAIINLENINDQSKLYKVEDLKNLAFDHKEIISQALKYLKQNLNQQIVKQLLPDYFSLNALQIVHEVIGKQKFDNRNFRKKILESGIVQKSNKVQKGVAFRPATLYKFTS